MENKCLIIDKEECVIRAESAITLIVGTIVAVTLAVPLISILSAIQTQLPPLPKGS